jgi:hypothetical protein
MFRNWNGLSSWVGYGGGRSFAAAIICVINIREVADEIEVAATFTVDATATSGEIDASAKVCTG